METKQLRATSCVYARNYWIIGEKMHNKIRLFAQNIGYENTWSEAGKKGENKNVL